MSYVHVASQFTVIGAGPYGMAVASYLRAAGLDVCLFGQPMAFWATRMPEGMLLRSPWGGSHIGDPTNALTLDHYESALGRALDRRLALADFVRYGEWFQQQSLGDADHRNVAYVEAAGGAYRITLSDGESLHTRNVVVAAGIGAFPCCPGEFERLPAELCSHTSDRANRTLNRFAGKHVAVIGAGQSAIESAALLHEGGARVEVIVRAPQVRWLNTRPFLAWVMDSKLYPLKAPGRIGPVGLDWLVEHPRLFTLASRAAQDSMAYRAIRPAASSWLRPRTTEVTLTCGAEVLRATEKAGKVELQLSDGHDTTVDHVLLGTGYKIDTRRYSFLSPDLFDRIQTVNGYPVLNRGYESTAHGVYFVGAVSAHSFGPYMRFVAGSRYAADVLSTYAARIQSKGGYASGTQSRRTPGLVTAAS